MKRIAIIITLITAVLASNAQNENDAIRYSTTEFGGTARYVSMAGAFGALGADFSVLSTNPAGIGLYRTSEFTFTPTVNVANTSTTHYGTSLNDNDYNFNIGNMGMVLTANLSSNRFKDDNEFRTWKNVNFGFGFNRHKNFHRDIQIEGFNNENNLMDDFAAKANKIHPDDLNVFDTYQAFYSYLLDTVNGNFSPYFNAAENVNMLQRRTILSDGAINEMVLTLGGNFGDKLYVGGTFGFPFIRYNESYTHTEIDVENTAPSNPNDNRSLAEYSYSQDLETRGAGFNFKFGMIYRVNDWVRFGGAVHTPTFYAMTDTWTTEMKATYDDGSYEPSEVPYGEYNYELTTPFKAIGNLAVIIGKKGLISAEYEYVDYSEAALDADDYGFFDENQAITNNYTATQNIKVGAEVNLQPVVFRGGFAMFGSPYQSGVNDGEKTMITGGFGIRDKYYFLDLGYAYTMYSEDYYMYPATIQTTNPTNIDYTNHMFLMTLGFKF